MRKLLTAVLVVVMLCTISGCMTLNHTVEGGGNGAEVARKKQWYILWGLIPLNKVDGGKIADENGLGSSYSIKSERNAGDIILNLFTGILTIQSQTVVVKSK